MLLAFILLCSVTSVRGAVGTTSTVEDIVDSCYNYLESHLCEGEKWGHKYHFYKPSIDKYSSDQWLWDSGAHMIVWSHKNVSNSILDLRTMLKMQQDNGRIPEEIFWMDRDAKQTAAILAEYSSPKFSDTTQMPVLPYSLRAIYQESKSKRVLKEFLYPLIDYFKWWRAERDIHGDGLVVIIHNWESGLDASPAYDPAFHTHVTSLNESAWLHLYPKFWELVETYKLGYHWNVTAILERDQAPSLGPDDKLDTWFVVKDLAVNSVYASGWAVLAELARELGDVTVGAECDAEYTTTREGIINKMWSKDQGHFQTLYVDSDGVEKFAVADTVQNLFPLLLKDLPSYYIDSIVSKLTDPDQFDAPMGVPTVSMSDPQFEPTFPVDLMWRGPVWGFTNWFVMEGLGIHGHDALQRQIFDKWLKVVQLSGIYEHYNPYTGAPYGTEGLGMSTLVCDWIYRYGLFPTDASNSSSNDDTDA